jgi:peroxiredoxin
MSEIKIGDKIPDFRLRDHKDKEVHLYDFSGKKVLLSFHSLAWTKVCAEQMNSLEENQELFTKLNTVAFGISVDPTPSKRAWGQGTGNYTYKAPFGLLAAWGGRQSIWDIQGKGRGIRKGEHNYRRGTESDILQGISRA